MGRRERESFDLAFSIGEACSCSWALRGAKLQYASYPFDWVARVGLEGRARIVETDFRDWLVQDRMRHEANTPSYNCDIYHNRVTGIGFNHDFPRGVPLADSFAAVEAKYRRRIDRLFADIRRSRRVLIAWVGVPESPEVPRAEIEYCLGVFRRKFPGVEFRMLLVECARGVPERAPRRDGGDGWERVAFDFEDHSKQGSRFQIRMGAVVKVFRRFAEVPDRRTPEEKRAYVQVEREKRLRKYAEYGAKSWLGYVVARRLAKLRRHFAKRREVK